MATTCRICLLPGTDHGRMDCISTLRTELRKRDAELKVAMSTVAELKAKPAYEFPPRPKDGEPLFKAGPQVNFLDTKSMPVAVKKPFRFVRNRDGWLWEVFNDGSARSNKGSTQRDIFAFRDILQEEAIPVNGEVWEVKACPKHYASPHKGNNFENFCYRLEELVECGCLLPVNLGKG